MTKQLSVITLLLAIVCASCNQETKKESSKNYIEIYNSGELLELRSGITEPAQKYNFYKHLYLVSTFEDLKKSDNKEATALKNYPDNVLVDLSKIIISEYVSETANQELDSIPNSTAVMTRREITTHLDSIFSSKEFDINNALHEAFVGTLMGGTIVESIDHNIVTIYRNFGTGGSTVYTYVIVEDNKVTNLGQVYDYLNKSDYDLLENEIKKKFSNYSYISSRSGAQLQKTKDNKYLVSLMGDTEDNPQCCPIVAIKYQTDDFKIIVPNSIVVEQSK